MTSVPIGADVDPAASAELRELDGRRVMWFRIAGGDHHGAIGSAGGAVIERAVCLAGELGVPLVGEFDTSGAELDEGVAALHAWGRIARELVRVSGSVPTLAIVTGACVSGPALLLGVFDVVVMTQAAFAYVSGPDSVATFTGVTVSRIELGGAQVHAARSGIASLVVDDIADARAAISALLAFLPDHHLDDPPRLARGDDPQRQSTEAANVVPVRANAAYDVRDVLADVLDCESFVELRPHWAANIVTGLAHLDGRPVGIVANQPGARAGTIDINASRKAARFVAWCDAFNLPLVTFVDTPGFEPGRDLEWRGMIRHGAELAHAYCAATVPRICVVLRKAYGGAYIVMDSRGVGNDYCIAWPNAEIAVMGAVPAVKILHRKRKLSDDEERVLVEEYELESLTPYRAAERGLVDIVSEPADTRRMLCLALDALASKRECLPARRHSNTPL